MVSLRGQSTWRVSSFMFLLRRLAMPHMRRGDLEHATSFFRAMEVGREPQAREKG